MANNDHHTFFGKLFAKVVAIFNKVKDEVKDDILPWAISATNALKTIENSTYAEMIAIALGKEKGTEILEKVKEATAKIAIALGIAELANTSFATDEEKVLYIVSRIKLSSDIKYDSFWHNLAAGLIHALSDGKISLGEAFSVAQSAFEEQTGKSDA